MEIAPLVQAPGTTPAGPGLLGPVGAAGADRRDGGAPRAGTATGAASLPEADLKRLKSLAAQAGLQVRVETLPQSRVTMMRLIDSLSGQLVAEFPPRGLAQALADLEARAANHSESRALDRRA